MSWRSERSKENHRKAQAARQRAFRRLAKTFPTHYHQLLSQEREEMGLTPFPDPTMKRQAPTSSQHGSSDRPSIALDVEPSF